jgi:hypothetical protein
MDAKEIRNLQEAYNQVYQLDEGRRTSLSALSRESQQREADKKRGRPETKAETHGRLMLGKFSPSASKEERSEGGRERLRDRGKVPQKGGKDMFEHILEHLVAEGYADTNKAALAIMANMSEEWKQSIVEEVLDEAEGSYGATPKAYSAASKTKMTAKRKPFLKAMKSRTNPANRTPDDSPRKGLTADDRERARAGAAHGVGTRQDHDYPSEGSGGVTKNPKKLRKQKAMGEHD